ncbi:transglutaminase domain-containing protein [Streptococcus phocae subsp. salmonis]|uniref:transglutaminase domain-containing protein n=1 Tax=Streptococcus phocae TaxID=119224 RepID=UPI0005312458|nr:transglutaminase domain-containing protein [Streptococcus phocae]KGR73324.1 S-layer protein [Streptococcus phocae subsp. salmonis]
MKKNFLMLGLISLSLLSVTACSLTNPFASASQEDMILSDKKRDKLHQLVASHYYYQQLDDAQKANYLLLYDSLSQFREVVSLSPASKASLIKTIDAFTMDNPAFFWVTTANYQLEMSDQVAFVTFDLPKDAPKIYQQLQAIGDDILSKAPAENDYERIKYFYDTIIQDTDYNQKAFQAYQSGDETLISSNQDIRSVLIDHLSVCNGYAQTFQFLCQKAGIPVAYIRGEVTSSQSKERYHHAWNAVEIDGNYYAVDTTWGDPVFDTQLSGQQQSLINYHFLCLPDQLLNQTHKASTDIAFNSSETFTSIWKIPKCSDDSLLYTKLNQSYFESFSQTQVLNSLSNQLAQKVPQISVQFANKASYDQLVADLEVHQTDYHQLFRQYFPDGANYAYSLMPDTYSVSFFPNV